MANDGNGKSNGKVGKTFNSKSNQPRSNSYSLTKSYIRKANSSEKIKNLREVESKYQTKKSEFLINLQIEKANFLKGHPQMSIGLGEMNKNKPPTQQEKDSFSKIQAQKLQTFEKVWKEKAKLAYEGKEWRDEKLKIRDKNKTEQSRQIKAFKSVASRGVIRKGKSHDKDRGYGK